MRPLRSCSSDFVDFGASRLWLLDGRSSFLYVGALVLLGWFYFGCCYCLHWVLSLVPPFVDWVTGVEV
jgi:hypothetical protein